MELDRAYTEERTGYHRREVMDWNPQGERKRGRPKETWRRSVHSEALGEGKSWSEVKQLARNTIRWRRFVNTLCP